MRITRFLRPLTFAAAIVCLGVPGMLWAQTGGMTGKVTLKDGQPCAKCIIQIDRLDVNSTYHVKTNKKGSYVYIGLPLGNYKVTLKDPQGNVLYFINNVHLQMGDPTVQNFDIPKLEKEDAQAHPEAAKKSEEQTKEEKQYQGLKQYFEQGNQAFSQKDYAAAIEAFQKALPLANPKNQPIVLGRIAESYDKTHQYSQAVATYQKVLTLTPDDAKTYNNLGSVYAEMNKQDDALQAFQKAATLDPTHAGTYYFNLGAIMYNQGKMDEAGEAFKKAIAADPKNANAYYYEGQALLGKATMSKDGKIQALPGTVEAFQKSLELDPNGPNAAAAKQMIQTLTGKVETQYKRKKGRN